MVKVAVSNSGEKSALQKKVEDEGYVWNAQYGMAEHRAVACKILGRVLETNEPVHHCDHNKQNNDPANLFVLSPAIHDLVHISTLLWKRRDWPCGTQLMDPNILSKFLKDEGIPHIWLWEAMNAPKL